MTDSRFWFLGLQEGSTQDPTHRRIQLFRTEGVPTIFRNFQKSTQAFSEDLHGFFRIKHRLFLHREARVSLQRSDGYSCRGQTVTLRQSRWNGGGTPITAHLSHFICMHLGLTLVTHETACIPSACIPSPFGSHLSFQKRT
jgi:hypothetical protein